MANVEGKATVTVELTPEVAKRIQLLEDYERKRSDRYQQVFDHVFGKGDLVEWLALIVERGNPNAVLFAGLASTQGGAQQLLGEALVGERFAEKVSFRVVPIERGAKMVSVAGDGWPKAEPEREP